MQPVSYVDIERFMGDWHVIANIPTFPERGAIDPVETYALNPDGTIETTFTFLKGAAREKKVLNAKGFIRENTNNAIWGMQFIWPIKADYRIVYLDSAYQYTIIGREKRDYLWIMARYAPLSDATLNELITIATALGYEERDIQITNWQTQPFAAAM